VDGEIFSDHFYHSYVCGVCQCTTWYVRAILSRYFHNITFNNPGQRNSFTVREIAILGNKKTKESVILRELSFASGETYALSELVKKFEIARKQLLILLCFMKWWLP
jgi:hypothetical protein